ncbi:MAG: transposase domain-containing protein [Treponema sp.]|nr:transposase domain-containing protein [Treponema sp.]
MTVNCRQNNSSLHTYFYRYILPAAAYSTCLLFSLIECARISNINPEEYLSSIFELAADTSGWTDSNWSELLPWNIKLIKKSDVSTVLIA